jgi:threonine dehydratase
VEPTISHIRQAAERLSGVVPGSPVVRSGYFSRCYDADVFLKLENLLETGSFKVRGAYSRLSLLSEEERKRGVVAASAGNHAQGVAWSAGRLGIRAAIVMPEDVSIKKLIAVKGYGAEVVLSGSAYSDAFARAQDMSRRTGMLLIPAFDDVDVVSGQGTVGLELADLLEEGAVVVVPVGGGGLISGIAVAVKELNPGVSVVGVQTRSCPSAVRSLEMGRPADVDVLPTLADGIAVGRTGTLNFPIIQRYVDEVVEVSEEGIAGAVLDLLEKANVLAEGAGATPLAAVAEGRVPARGRRVILVISGGNIETQTIDRLIQRGSVKMGRRIRIAVNIPDAPGSLWRLLGIIAEQRANILHILHDRMDLQNPLNISRVVLNLETRGHDHIQELLGRVEEAGYAPKRIL